ncbi:SusF/SusE family outer membrane protein [Flavobacterium sp. GA093]|uniref:SusF/SusE family outer membrane protein n=1 Tax=Flavobacterium hydrocarbonoxydans TaxID=2683249 RepID=A0A6I4NN07_9FLAO|nr:SusE domain-containing protein [Flavobacterium hydrocarbonoxydans]MWB94322.1 SusF/SusE family outer membrane protein [Flavobacterium hydrocarbonoxydans]
MKNIYKILFAFVSVLAVSCNADDVEDRPIIEAVNTPELIAPESGKTFVLDEDNAAAVADRFVWSSAKYSDNVVVTYTLLMDKKDGDFTEAKTLATTSNITQAEVLVRDLNQAAIDLGGETEVAALYDVKVMSSVSGGVPMTSESLISISVTPYSGRVDYDFEEWYLVGDASVAGWNNNNGNQILFRSATNPKEYKFTGFFKAGAFKTIKNLGNWAPMYGGADGSLVYRGTEADPDPASFVIAADGFYTFTMNIETLTYTLVAYDASAAATYSTVGIIGSSTAGGWDASTAMTQSTFDAHIWSLGVTPLNNGELKFRANDAWDVSWGASTPFTGVGSTAGGSPNIPVEKSKYVIYFNDLDGSYLMIPNQE